MAKEFIGSDYIEWCCETMKRYMYDDRFPLDLDVVTKCYVLPIMWPHRGTDLRINYCPWCAKSLPSLQDKRIEILEKEYGIEDFFDPNIPEEFQSEEWWIKRGL